MIPQWQFLQEILTEIREWMSNYIHSFIFDVIIHPCPNFEGGLTNETAVEVRAWLSNYISQ